MPNNVEQLARELRAIRASLMSLNINMDGGYIGPATALAEASVIRDRYNAFIDKLRNASAADRLSTDLGWDVSAEDIARMQNPPPLAAKSEQA